MRRLGLLAVLSIGRAAFAADAIPAGEADRDHSGALIAIDGGATVAWVAGTRLEGTAFDARIGGWLTPRVALLIDAGESETAGTQHGIVVFAGTLIPFARHVAITERHATISM